MRRTPIFAVLILGGLACLEASPAVSQGADGDPWAELEEEVRALGVDPDTIEIPGRLTAEMKRWLHERVSPNASADVVLRQVLGALIDPQDFKLVYDPGFTGTAEEVWATRKANCLGFTHLFVALTRELGLSTYYVRWSMVERFRREGDLVLVSGHVSAGWGVAGKRQVLEFGAVDGFEGHLSQLISDRNALARHYANRSAEMLRAGDFDEAVAAAELSIRLEPNLADAWVNLGVSRRRSGDLDGAEDAYLEATRVDPDHLAAYQNLSVLMYLRGADDAASEVMSLLDRRDNRNPFIYLALGDRSQDLGRLDEAARFYRRAHHLEPRLAETRAARGLLALAFGDTQKAEKWLRRAQAVDSEEARTLELTDKLSRTDDPSK